MVRKKKKKRWQKPHPIFMIFSQKKIKSLNLQYFKWFSNKYPTFSDYLAIYGPIFFNWDNMVVNRRIMHPFICLLVSFFFFSLKKDALALCFVQHKSASWQPENHENEIHFFFNFGFFFLNFLGLSFYYSLLYPKFVKVPAH